jgi:hypothetical protein
VCTGVWWGKYEGKVLRGRPKRRWEKNIKMDVKEIGLEVWTGLILFRIRRGGRLLLMRQYPCVFHNMLGIS